MKWEGRKFKVRTAVRGLGLARIAESLSTRGFTMIISFLRALYPAWGSLLNIVLSTLTCDEFHPESHSTLCVFHSLSLSFSTKNLKKRKQREKQKQNKNNKTTKKESRTKPIWTIDQSNDQPVDTVTHIRVMTSSPTTFVSCWFRRHTLSFSDVVSPSFSPLFEQEDMFCVTQLVSFALEPRLPRTYCFSIAIERVLSLSGHVPSSIGGERRVESNVPLSWRPSCFRSL